MGRVNIAHGLLASLLAPRFLVLLRGLVELLIRHANVDLLQVALLLGDGRVGRCVGDVLGKRLRGG